MLHRRCFCTGGHRAQPEVLRWPGAAPSPLCLSHGVSWHPAHSCSATAPACHTPAILGCPAGAPAQPACLGRGTRSPAAVAARGHSRRLPESCEHGGAWPAVLVSGGGAQGRHCPPAGDGLGLGWRWPSPSCVSCSRRAGECLSSSSPAAEMTNGWRKTTSQAERVLSFLMHPPGPLPGISPSALHRGIASFRNRILRDLPLTFPVLWRAGRNVANASMPMAMAMTGSLCSGGGSGHWEATTPPCLTITAPCPPATALCSSTTVPLTTSCYQ